MPLYRSLPRVPAIRLAALVAVVIITGITAVGTKLSPTLTNVSTSLR